MKHIYLSILCLFAYQLTQSQVTIYADDFENGLGNWTQTGQWGTATSQAYNGTYSLADSPSGNYLNNQTTYATLDSVFDLTTSLDANIFFKAKYDIENGFDYCYIDLSINNGSTWTTAYTINGEGNLANWSEFTINIGGFVGNSQVKMRYRLYTDGGYQSDGIFVDSLRITKDSVDNAPPLILHDPDLHYEGQVDTNYRTFTITDISGVASAILYYSVDGGAYSQIGAIDTNGDDFTYAIPPEDAGAYVDYYVEAIDSSAQTNSGLSDFYHYVAGNYIKYESGEVSFITSYASAGLYSGSAMRMTLDGLTTITTGFIGNYTDVNNPNDSMLFHVWTNSNGSPGSDMITPIMVFPEANLLQPHLITRIDLRPFESQLDSLIGDVFIGFTVPTGTVWLAQTTPGTSSRVQNFNGSAWSAESDDYHFRIVTDTMILPPVAEFVMDATGDPVIVFTDSSENNPTGWHWDFGDGDTSIVQNPTHSYDIGAYNVCLEVSNAAGSDEICKGMIIFNGPPSAFFTYSTSNDPEISFNDLSTQGPTSWSWDFGDGDTSTTQNPLHTFLDTGDFTVCLIVANAFGADTFCQTLHIFNRRPEAFFIYTVFLDTAVTFTDLSGFSPTAWSWDFDNNGDTSDVQNPGYLFPGTGGAFNVCLTASNAYGSSAPYCDDVEIKDLVGIDHIKANGVVISPNPAKDYASITLPNRFQNASYQVFSAEGKIVLQKSNVHTNVFSVDVSSLQGGVYFIEIFENETSFVKMPLMVID